MKKLWLFLVNTFEVNTRDSRRKMLRIANHHLARLDAMKSDPDILALFTLFEPVVLLFRSMLSTLDSGEGISKSNTGLFTKTLDEMSDHWFDEWQTMIRPIFGPDTPEFAAIFPKGKKPFSRTEYDLRMVAVDALYKTLLTYPALSAVATNVAAKLAILKNARDTQTTGFGTNAFTAAMIENQRVLLANLLDDDLCDLKKKYRTNISMVENFFDLAELRRASSDADARFAYKGAAEADVTSAVPVPDKLVLSANAACVFTNESNLTELQFFFSPNASAADNPVKVTVLPMQSVQTNAAESGWAPGANFIIVKNLGTITAEFELLVTEAVEG